MKRLRAPRVSGGDLREVRDAVLRAVSLVVTDRRWAAPLSAMALGFGLFLGVAIGPGTPGTFATGAGSIIAVAGPDGEQEPEAVETGEGEAPAAEAEPEAFASEPESFEEPFAEPEAFEPAPLAAPLPEEEAPPAEPPAEEEVEEEAGEAQSLKGAVVHANPAAGSYTMVIDAGEPVSVHAAELPLPGEKLAVEATPLANNTFAEEEREESGTAKRASMRGVVTYVDPDPADPAYTLSGRGSSILVHLPPSPAPELPVLGAYATVGVAIEKPPPTAEPAVPEAAEPEAPATCAPDPVMGPAPETQRVVVQRTIETEPEPATYFDLAGIVSAVCPATKQLLISADDLRASEDDLLLTVPDRIKADKLKIGESIVATASVEEDGTLTLAGLASDEGQKGAEAAASAQGDLKR
ncbi:MAG: hypothetical protein M3Y75_10850 [Actinomycetota bacterium]|nr:hypothetical protein [Actinomycetota bacterium]